jgi:hypothetical protein
MKIQIIQNKRDHERNHKRNQKRLGFTLVETAIAMGMVAVMISSFLVVFGPAIKGIEKSLGAKEADRLSSALELELSMVKPGESYSSALVKTYWWIRMCHGDNAVLVYQYRGDPANVRADGSLEPYYNAGNQYDADNPDTPGQDYVIQTSVRRRKDAYHNAKIEAELYPGNLVGKVYYVKLLQLRPDTDGKMVTPWNPWHVYTMQNPQTMTGWDGDYNEPVLAVQARFYEVKPALWSYVNNTFDPWVYHTSTVAFGKPVVTKNMAIMR